MFKLIEFLTKFLICFKTINSNQLFFNNFLKQDILNYFNYPQILFISIIIKIYPQRNNFELSNLIKVIFLNKRLISKIIYYLINLSIIFS